MTEAERLSIMYSFLLYFQVSYTFCKDFIAGLVKDMSATDFGRTSVLIKAFQRVSMNSYSNKKLWVLQILVASQFSLSLSKSKFSKMFIRIRMVNSCLNDDSNSHFAEYMTL